MTPLNNKYYTRLHQLCDCPECAETRVENHISEQLKKLPKIKAGAGFDQKMAALFALELDEEVNRKSRSLVRKSKKISIPGLIPDLSKEFN
ncbi:MAG: hypothetical protein EA391_03315 [Balneolaceae bacterium]|nr:MAG: hypothetical protein EA391_03315 [Balneolaceae bacterium]